MPRTERAQVSPHPALHEVPAGLDKPLSKVLTYWRRFELQTPEFERLQALTLEQAVRLANKAQRAVAQDMGFYDPQDPEGKYLEHPLQWREVTPEGANALAGLFGEKGSGPRYLAFRHGTQQASMLEQESLAEVVKPGEDTKKVDALKKFYGMYFPHNAIDETSEASLIEAIGLGVMLRWAQLHSGKTLILRSSEFYRAKQPAEVLAAVTGITLTPDPRLNSLGYRQPKDSGELEEMLHDLPKGSIPLDRELINKWGALVPLMGKLDCDPTDPEKQTIYDTLQARANSAMEDAFSQDPNVVVFDITHTQHHVFAGLSGDPGFDKSLRLAELGGLGIAQRVNPGQGESEYQVEGVLHNGVFAKDPSTPGKEAREEDIRSQNYLDLAKLLIRAGEVATSRLKRFKPTPFTHIGAANTDFVSTEPNANGNAWHLKFYADSMFGKEVAGFSLNKIGHDYKRLAPYVNGQRMDDPYQLAYELQQHNAALNPLRWMYEMQQEGALLPNRLLYEALMLQNRVQPFNIDATHGRFVHYYLRNGASTSPDSNGLVVKLVSQNPSVTPGQIGNLMLFLEKDLSQYNTSLSSKILSDVTIGADGSITLHWDRSVYTFKGTLKGPRRAAKAGEQILSKNISEFSSPVRQRQAA